MLKLALRDLFAVLTIVAVLVAWWVDHRRQTATQAALLEANRRMVLENETLRGVLNGYEISVDVGGLWRDESGPGE
jgi:hypothetical protein